MGFRNLIGSIGARAEFASRAGKTFGGARDLYKALGYLRKITLQDYRDRYKRNAVAGRIIDAKPQDTWRSGFELLEDEDSENQTPFEEAWLDLDNQFSVTSLMQRLDTLTGLGHYGAMLLGAEGNMTEPLETSKGLAYLAVFAEDGAKIQTLENDSTNPRFGLPLTYQITRRTGTLSSAHVSQVHHTRVLHTADGILEDSVFGTPRLERIWNLLDDLEKITGGGAEAHWKRADQGMQLDLDPSVELDDDGIKELKEEVDQYVHGLSRVMRTRGLSVNMLGSDTADIGGPADAILEQISAGTGIPHRILVGSEQAQLASSQDRTNWQQRIQARRAQYAEPQIIRPFVDRMVELGVLPEPRAGYEVRWSQISDSDEGDQVDYATKLAGLNTSMGDTVVTIDEIRTRALGWGTLVGGGSQPTVATSPRGLQRYGVAAALEDEPCDFEDR